MHTQKDFSHSENIACKLNTFYEHCARFGTSLVIVNQGGGGGGGGGGGDVCVCECVCANDNRE